MLQKAAGSKHGHPRLGGDLQRHALISWDKQDSPPSQGDVGESGGGGGRGVAVDDQQDAGAVDGSYGVLLHRGWDLQMNGDG